MSDNIAKYILLVLALIYIGSGITEIVAVKGGVEAVFESVKTFVPHLMMFMLGIYFSKK